MTGDDPELPKIIRPSMAGGWSMLAGTAACEGLHESWSVRLPSSPMTQALTSVQKCVASQGPQDTLVWEHSTLLTGEAETMAQRKREQDKPLVISGSGVLVRSLLGRGLMDAFVLMIRPLVLGRRKRLHDDGTPPTPLTSANAITTRTGVLVATGQLAPG